MKTIRVRLRAYGRRLDVERIDGEWRGFYVGVEGKRRPATDIASPADTPPDAVATAIADLLHEWATPRYPDVEVLD